MGLTELFNEFIVEHGSAKVQEKHIALFKDQLALADKSIAKLESEIASLKNKLKNSQTTIEQLTKENDELKQRIKETDNSSHSSSLDDQKVKILSFLAKFSDDDEIDARYIALQCKASEQATLFHLGELEQLDFIYASRTIGGSPTWYLAHEGRRYLIQNSML
jgi:seryl-tRNA synthetase